MTVNGSKIVLSKIKNGLGVLFFSTFMIFIGCSSEDNLKENHEMIENNNNNNNDNNNGEEANSVTATLEIKNTPSYYIGVDEKVSVKLDGSFTVSNDNFFIKEKGFIYVKGTGTPDLANADKASLNIEYTDKKIQGELKELQKGETYSIRAFFQLKNDEYFYSETSVITTPTDVSKTRMVEFEILKDPKYLTIQPTSILSALEVNKVVAESPVELGVEYSTTDNFTSNVMLYSITLSKNITLDRYGIVLLNLSSKTKYYMRPYAKYRDGKVFKGKEVDFTTK